MGDLRGAGHDRARLWRRGARVRQLNLALAIRPSSQPTIDVTRTSQTSEMWELPISQSTLTCAVFDAASAINTATSATATIA